MPRQGTLLRSATDVQHVERASPSATQDEATNDHLQKQDDHDRREIKLPHGRKDPPRTPHEWFSCAKEPLIDGEHHSTWSQWEPRQNDAEKNDENVKVQQLTQKFAHKLFEL
jgi:hypothetical protein